MLSLVVICLQDNTKMYNKSVSWVLKKKKRFVLQYAQHSSGVIHVLLNGSAEGGAYPVKG